MGNNYAGYLRLRSAMRYWRWEIHVVGKDRFKEHPARFVKTFRYEGFQYKFNVGASKRSVLWSNLWRQEIRRK